MELGWSEGLRRGQDQGRREGREEGVRTAYRSVILRLGQQSWGRRTPALRRRLESITDVTTLAAMSRRVLDATSWSTLLQTPRSTPSRGTGRQNGHRNGR